MSVRYAAPKDIGLPLLKALGIDSNGVRSIRLDIAVDSIPTVTITRFVNMDQASLDEVFKRFSAVKVEKEEQYRIEEKP